mmetsp:Transcript_7062/g.23388  ORF Transcript_7062/g.23388 Transcript_7062/m.23388 type:complete len:305 (-) Transcript_7062:13-927(-)
MTSLSFPLLLPPPPFILPPPNSVIALCTDSCTNSKKSSATNRKAFARLVFVVNILRNPVSASFATFLSPSHLAKSINGIADVVPMHLANLFPLLSHIKLCTFTDSSLASSVVVPPLFSFLKHFEWTRVHIGNASDTMTSISSFFFFFFFASSSSSFPLLLLPTPISFSSSDKTSTICSNPFFFDCWFGFAAKPIALIRRSPKTEAPPANEDKDDCWWSNFIIIETSIPTFPFVVKPPPNGDEIDDVLRSFTIEAVPEYPPNPKLGGPFAKAEEFAKMLFSPSSFSLVCCRRCCLPMFCVSLFFM